MARRFVLIGTIAAVLITMVCVGCAAAVPSPSRAPAASSGQTSASAGAVAPASSAATPEPSAAEAQFASNRYGFEMAYPADWKTWRQPGVGGLHPGEGDEAGMDLFTSPFIKVATKDGGTSSIMDAVGVSHYPLPAGTTLDKWVSPTENHIRNDHHTQPESTMSITVGGEPARLETYHVTDSENVYTAYVVELVHNGAGYTIEDLYGQPLQVTDMSKFDTTALAMFQSMLASLKFQ